MFKSNKPTLTEQARSHTSNALDMFTTAHDQLDLAVRLLEEAEKNHEAKASIHALAAEEARVEREHSARIQSRLAALLA